MGKTGIQLPSEPFVYNIQYDARPEEKSKKFQLYLGPNYADSLERRDAKDFHPLFERIFRSPVPILLHVPGGGLNGAQLDRGFIKDFAREFPYPRVFLTRNLDRAWQKFSDLSFFDQPKQYSSFIVEAEVAPYTRAIEFLKAQTPASSFVLLLAHNSATLAERLQERLDQGDFKQRHVIMRACNAPGLCVANLSQRLLESGDQAALSVTYTTETAFPIPMGLLEMYYIATHPQLLTQKESTPMDVITSVDKELTGVMKTSSHEKESFEKALVQWWTNYSGGQPGEAVPEQIRELIEQLSKSHNQKRIKEFLDEQHAPVQEVTLPASVRYHSG